MSIDLETQKNLATFLSITIEHAMDLYIEQAVDKPKPPDITEDPPGKDTINNDTKSVSSPEKTGPCREKFYKDFDNYLSRLKGFLGQIDTLSKLTMTCSKNNLFDFNQTDKNDREDQKLHLIKALHDVREKQNTQIGTPNPDKDTENDEPTPD